MACAGAITFPDAEKAAQVLAIESDPALTGTIEKELGKGTNIRVRQADILRTAGLICVAVSPFWAAFSELFTSPQLAKLARNARNRQEFAFQPLQER